MPPPGWAHYELHPRTACCQGNRSGARLGGACPRPRPPPVAPGGRLLECKVRSEPLGGNPLILFTHLLLPSVNKKKKKKAEK